jgi:hypothetical protein
MTKTRLLLALVCYMLSFFPLEARRVDVGYLSAEHHCSEWRQRITENYSVQLIPHLVKKRCEL